MKWYWSTATFAHSLFLFQKEQAKRQEEIERLREYAGHGFKYGGASSQINKMSMKAKQADKLEQAQIEHAKELAALQEDIELWVVSSISLCDWQFNLELVNFFFSLFFSFFKNAFEQWMTL